MRTIDATLAITDLLSGSHPGAMHADRARPYPRHHHCNLQGADTGNVNGSRRGRPEAAPSPYGHKDLSQHRSGRRYLAVAVLCCLGAASAYAALTGA